MKIGLLLSGGMDSLSMAWWKRPDVGVTIDYGQLAAEAEITASRAICERLGIDHHILHVDCRAVGSGDMAGTPPDSNAPAADWWPYRNQLLVTLAAMKVIGLGVTELLLGTVKSDGSHKDGTPEFLHAMNSLLLMQEGAVQVRAPAIAMTTAELIRSAGVPYHFLAWAHSCHKANVACGQCRGCNKYFEVLRELGNEVDRSGQSSAAR